MPELWIACAALYLVLIPVMTYLTARYELSDMPAPLIAILWPLMVLFVIVTAPIYILASWLFKLEEAGALARKKEARDAS